MNNSITGAQGNTTPLGDKIGQLALGLDIDGLWVGRCMTKALQHQIGTKAQAG